MKERYEKRVKEAHIILGGKCVKCGTTENLQIDHINKALKSFDLGKLWSVSKVKYLAELEKCQLLCKEHHKEKSALEQSVGHGEGLTGKKNCRCSLCAPLKNEYIRQFRKQKLARVAEKEYAEDLKSSDRNVMSVQI